jgi:2',3'-cyclic-nucleotide 2'-phosphodiesterase
MLKLLFLGDVVGKSGREAVVKQLPALIAEHKPDCVIVNAENAAHGFGVTKSIAEDLFQVGVNVITTGNHVWDKSEILTYIHQEKRILRPQNYPPHLPGSGVCEYETIQGKKIVVINVMGRLFMEALDDPFASLDAILNRYNLGRNAHAIFVDVHAETTSEKQAIAHYVDGRVSAVVGTHTHVPTSDERIFPKGTAYLSDAGMCGDYFNSIIGMQVQESLNKFLKRLPYDRMKPAEGEGTVCGVLVTVNADGLATQISRIRAGKPL